MLILSLVCRGRRGHGDSGLLTWVLRRSTSRDDTSVAWRRRASASTLVRASACSIYPSSVVMKGMQGE